MSVGVDERNSLEPVVATNGTQANHIKEKLFVKTARVKEIRILKRRVVDRKVINTEQMNTKSKRHWIKRRFDYINQEFLEFRKRLTRAKTYATKRGYTIDSVDRRAKAWKLNKYGSKPATI